FRDGPRKGNSSSCRSWLRPARRGARPELVEVAAWSVIEAEHVTGENVVVSRCEIYVGATPSRRGHWCCERVDRLREMG
ncbi:hypothetical protein ACC771_21175, partial [Rhizobium ruizarguesonis]